MVTWGTNTVHTIGGGSGATSATTNTAPPSLTGTTNNAPGTTTTGGGFSFGSTAAATPSQQPATATTTGGGGFFGSTPTSSLTTGTSTTNTPSTGTGLFGSTSFSTPTTSNTAPNTSGGLFGSTTSATPANSGGLFGSSSTTPSFGMSQQPHNSSNSSSTLFGSTTGTGTTSSLFGNTSTGSTNSLFGNTGSIFGSPAPSMAQQQQQQQQQQQKPQIPAHAALQAHMNAYIQNEEARVLQRMQSIYQTYTGTTVATESKSHVFTVPLYNPITEQQRQLQDAVSSIVLTTNQQGFTVSTALVAPTKPIQICDHDWNLACIRNPDSQHFIPTAIVGADNLLARAILHQEQSTTIQKHLLTVQDAIEHLQNRQKEIVQSIEYAKENHMKQRTRLLKIMKAVEVRRCYNLPLQSAEIEAFQRIRHLKNQIIEQQVVPEVFHLVDSNSNNSENNSTAGAINSKANTTSNDAVVDLPTEQQQQQWMTVMKEHRAMIGTMTEQMQKEQTDLQLIYDHVIGSHSSGSNNTNILGTGSTGSSQPTLFPTKAINPRMMFASSSSSSLY